VICPRCGCPDFIDLDGPRPVCRDCLRAAVAAAQHPELLRPEVIRLLERDHPSVLLGFDRGPRGVLVKSWRWIGP
jgi:hypothetical protein